jgi:ammonia channel protein AmtB
LPGLALFYGGMVRKKNIISVIAQSTAAFAVVSVLWFIAGYSLAFGKLPDAVNGYIGGSAGALPERRRLDHGPQPPAKACRNCCSSASR